MKKIFCVFLAVVLLASSCGTNSRGGISIDDPFSKQLQFYNEKQKDWKWSLIISASVFALSFMSASYFITDQSLNGRNGFNNFGVGASYTLTPIAFGWGAFSFYEWSKYVDLYLETLRLQTQYYNVMNDSEYYE